MTTLIRYNLAVLFFVGWFYFMRFPADAPGAMVESRVGPFQTQEQCNAARSEAADVLGAIIPMFEISNGCIKREGA